MECPPVVRIAYPDGAVVPFYNGRGKEVPEDPGLLIKWMVNAVNKTKCHPEVQFSRLPQRRIDLQIAEGDQDLVPAMAPTEERLKNLVFPGARNTPNEKLALVRGNLNFYTLRGTETGWPENKKLWSQIAIGVVRGAATETIATKNSWKMEIAGDAPTNFKKLLLGRVQAVFEVDLIANAIIKELGEDKIEMLSPAFVSSFYYPVFSRQFYDQFPEFSQQIWVNACRESHTYFNKPDACSP